MGENRALSSAEERPIFQNPWPALGVALTMVILAFALTWLIPLLVDGAAIWRTMLLAPGILAAGIAVYLRPRAPIVLLLASLVALLASLAIAVPITHRSDGENTAAPATAQDGSLHAQSNDLSVDQGSYYSPALLATAQDADAPRTSNKPGDVVSSEANTLYTASIHWGDGSTSIGLMQGGLGEMTVKGTHIFQDEGFYPGQITITGPQGRHVTVGFTTRVATWDTGRLLLRILAVMALSAAVIVLLPVPWQRAAVSLVILFHFGGILAAITNVDPAPWLSAQLWTYIYRPYLQFMYMNNAYHYYAPDPGPASLLWFRVEYGPPEDGKDNNKKSPTFARWLRLAWLDDDCTPRDPDGKPFRLRVEYTRRLSIAESVNQQIEIDPASATEREQARSRLALSGALPYHPILPAAMQFREPPPVTKLWIQSYVRHVAHAWPHPPELPDWKVRGIKVYLVHHAILNPEQFAKRTKDNPQGDMSPNDVTTFQPFYMGDFEPTGQMKDTCGSVDTWGINTPMPGRTVEKVVDPLLYWLIPIFRQPKPEKMTELQEHPERVSQLKPEDYEVLDGLKRQNGDSPWSPEQAPASSEH